MLMRAAKVVHVMDEGVIVESGEYGNLKSLVGVNSRKEAWMQSKIISYLKHNTLNEYFDRSIHNQSLKLEI